MTGIPRLYKISEGFTACNSTKKEKSVPISVFYQAVCWKKYSCLLLKEKEQDRSLKLLSYK